MREDTRAEDRVKMIHGVCGDEDLYAARRVGDGIWRRAVAHIKAAEARAYRRGLQEAFRLLNGFNVDADNEARLAILDAEWETYP